MSNRPERNQGGGHKGNWNRLKHGFYSQRLRKLDLEGAKTMSLALDEELALLRSMVNEYVAWAEVAVKPEMKGQALELAGRAITRIGSLVRLQTVLIGAGTDESVQALIERVMGEPDEEIE